MVYSLDGDYLKSGVSTRGRNLHLRSESIVHVSEFRKDLSTSDLLFVELGNSGSVGRQTGERNNLFNVASSLTTISTLNNRNLGDANGLSLLDKGVLHLRAFFRFLLGNLGKLDSLLLLLLLGLDGLALLLLLLLLDLLLLLGQSRAGSRLDSKGESSSLGRLDGTTLSSNSLITLVLVVVSTQTLQFRMGQSGVFNFNSLAIIDNSAVGSFNNNDVISRSKKE